MNGPVHVGVKLPAQEPPSDHFLQASLEVKKSRGGGGEKSVAWKVAKGTEKIKPED